MVLKTFEIDFNGKKETIEYESDVEYAKIQNILKFTVDSKKPMETKVNIPEYQMQILQAVITKAPFDSKKISEITKLPGKTVVKIIDKIMDDYAMGIFLEGWMKTLLGSETMTDLLSESTPSVPQTSVGTNKKQTDNQQNGSKT